MKENGTPIRILLVEDNAADVRLTVEAFKEGKITNDMLVARDGIEALDILQQRGRHAGTPHPDLILLDLNLPKMDGREVLARVKEDPRLKRIPVVVLTTSAADEDIFRTYNLHANCYITKPVDLDRFLEVIKTIEDFWLTVVSLPPR